MEHPIIAAIGVTSFNMMFAAPLTLAWTGAAAYSTGREVVSAIPSFVRTLSRIGRGGHEFSAPMLDTNAARSMRQASLRAIHDSGYMLRAVIGSEAKIMHR